ncbi:MAG: inositol-3-phosphate synthase, partial [Myxococcota bacterium]
MKKPTAIKPASGKLGILLPGMGAVGTTIIAGAMLVRKGHSKPFGSLTQMGSIRLGKRTDNRSPLIKDFISLANLDNVVFGGWDLFPANAYESAMDAKVLTPDHLNLIKDELSAVKPM